MKMRFSLLVTISFLILLTLGCAQKPTECNFPEGIECSNLKITKDSISFDITNNLEDIGTISFKIQGCTESAKHGMRKGDAKTYTLSNCNNRDYVEKTITIEYNYRSVDFHDIKTGTVKGRVQ